MNWENTVIKSEDIKWKRPPIKNIKDGKLDIIITIPLTDLIRSQAKHSFMQGMSVVIDFFVKHQKENKPIEHDELVTLFKECNLPELVERIT